MLCSECTQLVYESAETDSLDSNKACIEISTRHNWIWPKTCLQCRLEFVGICRMDRKYIGLEEHVRLLFYLGVCHGFLVQQETKLYGFEYRRSRVYSIECAKQCGFTSSWSWDGSYDYNQSCVKLFENPVFHDRSKHVEIKYHFRDMMQRKAIHM